MSLRQLTPTKDDALTTVDIIAIHDHGSSYINRFEDLDGLMGADMLPAAIPEARMFTFDCWYRGSTANDVKNEVETSAYQLLDRLLKSRTGKRLPLVFVAFGLGGSVVAEAVVRAARREGPYTEILMCIAGILFFGEPDKVPRLRGNNHFADHFGEPRNMFRRIIRRFETIARSDPIQLSVHAFDYGPDHFWGSDNVKPGISNDSTSFHGFVHHDLSLSARNMDKSSGPAGANFKSVQQVIRTLTDYAPSTVRARWQRKRHFMVPFTRNPNFSGRDSTLEHLMSIVPPDADTENCQKTLIVGIGGIGKSQLAAEIAFRIHEKNPQCSIFWVRATTSLDVEEAYRKIGHQLNIPGIDEDDVDVLTLVQVELSNEAVGKWLMVVDDANVELLTKGPTLRAFFHKAKRARFSFLPRIRA
ncbi:Fc.00g077960.m01.CDS01 [Cosmosporella sp. VM-42]